MFRNDCKTLYRRVLTAAMAALLCIFPAAVFAVDTDYSGYVDPVTNEPLTSSANSDGSSRVSIVTGIYYDWTTRDFVYPVDGALTEVHASVMDGMIVTEPVSITTGGDISVAVFCNGEEYTGDLTNIREVGSYAVSVRQGSSLKRLFTFSITGPTLNDLSVFTVPDNFYVTAAMFEGEDVYQDRYNVDLTNEGFYSIDYECGPTGLGYTLEFTVDKTPPRLEFTGRIDSQQRVHSALGFSGLEAGDKVVLIRDGVAAEPELHADGTGRILDSGNYIMRVYDAAGNMREYSFTIMLYLNVSSWLFILLVLASIAAVVVYVVMKRKRLKIG